LRRDVLTALLALAIVFGVALRLGSIAARPWRADELATLVVLAGCSDVDLQRMADGRPHAAAELLACQRASDARGTVDLARAVLDEGPQNLPFYFVVARAATRALGWEWTPRLVSAIASTLALAAAAALGQALFGSWLAGAIVAALAAVSPLQVRFGLDARDYALWSLGTVLSSWLLLRAYAANRRRDWLVYGLAQALALQANLLATPSALALLCWGAVFALPPRLGPGSPLRRHVAVLAAALATLVPWALAVLLHHGAVRRTLGWTALPMPLPDLARRWLGNLTEGFLRTGADGGLVGDGGDAVSAALRLGLAIAVVLLVAGAMITVLRTRQARVWSFPLFLGGALFVAFALADVVLGGRRSMMARYVLPSWWAAELLVAGAMVVWLDRARSPRVSRAASATLVVVLALGAWSSFRAAAQPAWWDVRPELLRAQLAEAALLRAAGGTDPVRRADVAAPAVATPAIDAADIVYWIDGVPKFQVFGFAHLVPSATRFVLGASPPRTAREHCTELTLFHPELDVLEPRVLRCDAASVAAAAP
jgi:uncharacterized membrane protein